MAIRYSNELVRRPSGSVAYQGLANFQAENINATGNKFAFCGPVWFEERTGTKAIRRVGFRFNTVVKAGGSALTVSLQNVSLTAGPPIQPDEVQDQTVAIANGDATFVSNTWHRSGVLSADRTVNFGEMLAVVIEYDGGGRKGADNFQIARVSNSLNWHGSACVTKLAGVWAAAFHVPNLVLEFSDGTFGTLQGAFPVSALGNFTYNSGSAPDEYALEVAFDRNVTVDLAYWALTLASASADFELVLYQGTTILATLVMDANRRAGNTLQGATGSFATVVNLTAGTTYRLAIRPTTANNVLVPYFDVAAAGHLACHMGGSLWTGVTSRTDLGAWAAATGTRRLWLFPSIMYELPAVPEPTFSNANLTIGLTWMIVTCRSGAQYVWSDRPLPDRSTYYLGWKEPRVLEWGDMMRALSDIWTGEYESSTFKVSLNDTDRVVRGLDNSNELINATVVVYMITDTDRRAELPARVVFRGVVRGAQPVGILKFDLTIKDFFSFRFDANGTKDQIPKRQVTVDDFPNCGVESVTSSAEGYLVNGGHAIGATHILVRTGHGLFAAPDIVILNGNYYTVTDTSEDAAATVGAAADTFININPALTTVLVDGQAVTVVANHSITPAVGKRVPIAYGHMTDMVIDSTGGNPAFDHGNGQGPVIYVGDRVMADGKTYGEFLWTGHACYSPGGKPIPMLYFFDESVDNFGSSIWGVTYPNIGSLATEAAAAGRIGIPGYGNWAALGLAGVYVDYNGRRYTTLYLRGIFRDWTLGIRPAPANLSVQTNSIGSGLDLSLAIDAYGCETVGDGTGSLIHTCGDVYLHVLQNWGPPTGDGYQSGAWAASPTFADDTTMPVFDENSFAALDAQAAIYVTSGFEWNFIIGAQNEAVSMRTLVARMNLSCGARSGFNRNIQYFVTLLNTDLATTTLQAGLSWIRDIFSGSWAVQTNARDIYTSFEFRHTQDYLDRQDLVLMGRLPHGWRSVAAPTYGVLPATPIINAAAEAIFGERTTGPEIDFFMIRGLNIPGLDSTEYQNGTDTAAFLLDLLQLLRARVIRIANLDTGPAGYSYELGDIVPLTHYEGVSATGWTDQNTQLERLVVKPSDWTSSMELLDVGAIVT